ncbi:MAG: prolipoprotein diacylglyceryl transferase [Bdellovibrionales bacterium]
MYPILFTIGDFAVPSYHVVLSLLSIVALVWALFRANKFNLDRGRALDMIFLSLVGGFLGARLFHVIFEYPEYYAEDPMRVFEVWRGGFVFYGGGITGFLLAYIYCRIQKVDYLKYMDRLMFIGIAMYGLGRIACLLAGCCHGAECELPWAIQYPKGVEAPHGVGLHPTPIYASLWAFMNLLFLKLIETKNSFLKIDLTKSGSIFCLAMLVHAVGRIVMESFRADFRGDALMQISLSTWISLLLIAFFLGFLGKIQKDTRILK